MEGRYQIMVPSDNAILQVSYLGYVTEEIKVKRAPQHQCDAERRLQSAGRSCSSRLRTAEKGKRSRFYEFHQTKDIVVPSRSLNNSLAGQVAGLIAVQRSGEPDMIRRV
mgnify:CR=1 FL=1